MTILPAFVHKAIFRALGWTTSTTAVLPDRAVIFLVAPHTTIWDFGYGFFFYRSLGGHLRVMIKKESFFFPAKYILRAMGGFPVDRSTPQRALKSVIDEMNACKTDPSRDPFHLVICPEGTRKAIAKWKTGYHTIALATGAPVYLVYLDYRTKTVNINPEPVQLTDDPRADTDRIQQMYEEMALTARYPEGYRTR